MISHMQSLRRSRLAALHGFPSSGSAFRGALAPQQHVGRHFRSPGVPVGTAALSQLHRYTALSLHRYTALKAQRERSPDYSNSGLDLDTKIGRVQAQIEAAGKEVEKAELTVQEIQVALRDVQAKLASSSSPVLSKKEKDALLMLQQQLLTDLQYERTKVQQVRTKKQQLRTEELQLRTEKQQLREEKLQLIGKLGGPATPDRDGTAMMARIRELKGEVPAPGEVLSFSGFTSSLLLDANQNSVYIRGCYKPLFEALLKFKSKDAIITGTPGIGKSYFLYYLLTRLLALPEPPPYILLEHFGGRGKMWCYDHATGEVLLGTRAAFMEQLQEPKAWYISDGLEPSPILSARTILLSSPCRSRYKELLKVGAETLYMPLWTLEELLDCRAKVFGSTVPKELAMQLYERFGGVARYVLCLPSRQGTDDPAARLKKLEEVLDAALSTCDISQVGRGIGALEIGPEVSHWVVHIKTKGQDSFELSHLDFASEWVAEAYFELSKYSNISKLAELMKGTSGTIRGVVHKQLEHRLLPEGGDYTIKPIDGVTLACGKAEGVLWLPAASDVRRFQDVHEIMDDSGCLQEEVYYWPRNKNFLAADSLLRVGKTLHLFQMTVSSTDTEVSADGLTKLYESLGATDKCYEHLNLYFVVPPEVFKSFKLGPALKSWPPTDKQPDALRTCLYVLKGGKRG